MAVHVLVLCLVVFFVELLFQKRGGGVGFDGGPVMSEVGASIILNSLIESILVIYVCINIKSFFSLETVELSLVVLGEGKATRRRE